VETLVRKSLPDERRHALDILRRDLVHEGEDFLGDGHWGLLIDAYGESS
jgi:hypothetical protein